MVTRIYAGNTTFSLTPNILWAIYSLLSKGKRELLSYIVLTNLIPLGRSLSSPLLPPPPTSTEVDTGPHTLKKSLWTLGFTYGQSPHTDDDFCCGKHLFSRWQWTNQYPNHGDLPLYVRQGFSVRVLVIHCVAFLDYDNVINNQK